MWIIGLLKSLPDIVIIIRKVLSHLTALFTLLYENYKERKIDEIEADLGAALKEAAKQVKAKKKKTVKAIQDALSGNHS